jgi:hypothetical protein
LKNVAGRVRESKKIIQNFAISFANNTIQKKLTCVIISPLKVQLNKNYICGSESKEDSAGKENQTRDPGYILKTGKLDSRSLMKLIHILYKRGESSN